MDESIEPFHVNNQDKDIKETHQSDNYSASSSDSLQKYEPLFNYTRVKGDLELIFEKDSASVVVVTQKFLVLGSHWGHIYVLDLLGNISKDWASHNAAVTCLSLNSTNDYLVSGGDDGYVILHELFTDNKKVIANHLRPIKAVEIEPTYSASSGRIISGGLLEQLILHEHRPWPLSNRDILIDDKKGSIRTILWKDEFLAVANQQGVIIYDTKTFNPLTIIDHLTSDFNPDIYPVRLFWKSLNTLIVLWGNCAQVVDLKHYSLKSNSNDNIPALNATVCSILENDQPIAGISLLDKNYLLLEYPGETETPSVYDQDTGNLVSNNESNSNSTSKMPLELRVVNDNYDEILNDLIQLPSLDKYKVSDYNFITLNSENDDQETTWYIISPKQIIELTLKSFTQQISWYIDNALYELAYNIITTTISTGKYKFRILEKNVDAKIFLKVGQLYAKELISNEQYEQAIDVLSLVLNFSKMEKNSFQPTEIANLWESWAYEFAAIHQLHLIATYIPTDLPAIPQTIYEMILAHLLEKNTEMFCKTINHWPVTIYNVNSIEIAVLDKIDRINSENNSTNLTVIEFLYLALADILNRSNKIDKALVYYLIIRYPGIIQRIETEKLEPKIRNLVMLVMEYDKFYINEGKKKYPNNEYEIIDAQNDLKLAISGEGVNLLVKNTHVVPPATVVAQLIDEPWFIYVYLHALYQIDHDVGSQFADMQVELYSEYNNELLISFLRNNTHYNLSKACQICESRSLITEMVYLLGRMGDFRKALLVILYDLRDIKQAIEFAREQNDADLWNDLVKISGLDNHQSESSIGINEISKEGLTEQSQEFTSDLIEKLRLELISDSNTKYVSSTALLRNIPINTRIRGLDKAVLSKLKNYRLRVDLLKSCHSVLNTYNHTLSMQWRTLLSKGISVEVSINCDNCSKKLFFTENCNYEINGSAPSAETAVSFWCGHSYHLGCLLLPQVIEKVLVVTNSGKNNKMKHQELDSSKLVLKGNDKELNNSFNESFKDDVDIVYSKKGQGWTIPPEFMPENKTKTNTRNDFSDNENSDLEGLPEVKQLQLAE
ncbi:hypothetical protein BB561_004600 [Smittium simulii]|uniref:Vps41 beta-propeller domain-containing protein n=1 Tax=Smittium simulii TaxID=133385 RepID=A0A2T9YFE8_9FUNG|nr:hypothetical protein BB561_004600 [Smittium simulii]